MNHIKTLDSLRVKAINKLNSLLWCFNLVINGIKGRNITKFRWSYTELYKENPIRNMK